MLCPTARDSPSRRSQRKLVGKLLKSRSAGWTCQAAAATSLRAPTHFLTRRPLSASDPQRDSGVSSSRRSPPATRTTAEPYAAAAPQSSSTTRAPYLWPSWTAWPAHQRTSRRTCGSTSKLANSYRCAHLPVQFSTFEYF